MAADPYASGRAQRHRKAESARRKVRFRGSSRRRSAAKPRRRRRSKFPTFRVGGPGTMLWSIVTLTLGTVALLVQTVVWIVATLVSLAVTAAVAHIERRTTTSGGGTRPSKTSGPGGSSKPGGGGSGGTGRRRSSAQVINCRVSHLQVTPKKLCRDHRRHVVSQDGVDRFKQPLGTPIQ